MSEMDDRVADLVADVQRRQAVDDSAKALIGGFAQRLADAIAAAQAAGATPQQLQSVRDLHTAVSAQTQELADAVEAAGPGGGGGNDTAAGP